MNARCRHQRSQAGHEIRAGAISRYNIGLVITTGMSVGTLFTIFVVPAVYLALGWDHRPVAAPATG